MNAAGQRTARSSTGSLCASLLHAARVMLPCPRFPPRPSSCPVIFISLLFIASIGPVSTGALFSRQHSAYTTGGSAICQNRCHAEVSPCCYNDSAKCSVSSCAMSASCRDRVTSDRARTHDADGDAAYALTED